MVKVIKTAKADPADLTWEDKNPSSYMFNTGVHEKLSETLKKAKEKLKQSGAQKE